MKWWLNRTLYCTCVDCYYYCYHYLNEWNYYYPVAYYSNAFDVDEVAAVADNDDDLLSATADDDVAAAAVVDLNYANAVSAPI